MLLGIVGAPNKGKSTFFSAATLIDVAIAPYPFTTIQPNTGATYVRVPCPHVELGLPRCDPHNSKCENGIRLIPAQLIDVAGLVPDAHLGKGLGNKFLGDLAQAEALIQVIDASGKTDNEGKEANSDPADEIAFLENEISWWIEEILKRSWPKLKGKGMEALATFLSGLKVTRQQAQLAAEKCFLPTENINWNDEDILKFAKAIQHVAKPILIAANKIDVPEAAANYEKLKTKFPNHTIIPVSAASELALRKAAEKKLITYLPGDADFKILAEMQPAQKQALEFIHSHILQKYGSTGVQTLINKAFFDVLNLIAVYPVEDETHLTNHFGKILPDAFLVPRGTTALQFAEKIHSDLANHFLHAIDVRTKRRVGKEHILQNGDIIRIVAAK